MTLDDDKRQLRLYQERYLADGDLHSDGPGRVRRFRWKNIGTVLGRGRKEGRERGRKHRPVSHLSPKLLRWNLERWKTVLRPCKALHSWRLGHWVVVI